MNTSRGFLHITYKVYHHLDLVDGEKKSHCLNVLLSVMKYAWKKNGYRADLRHETIHKDTGLCRTTIKSCLETLNKLNIVKSIRGRSGKTYIVNEVFLKVEKTYESFDKPQIAVKPSPDSRFTATLVEELSINNISKIVKGFAGDKDRIINELSKLPLDELRDEKVNVYFCKLAIQKKEDDEKESKATYVHGDKIVQALSKIRKQTNPRYKAKVEYNKRNGIKPWENK
ncbi:putative transcriptional regulator [Pelagibacter phage Greip EXVC021P]|nr:putative transcriptional regulator [Pelagibacter phage Greip EXVC021P]